MSRRDENRRKIDYLLQYINVSKEFDEVLQSYQYYKQRIYSLQNAVLSDMPKSQSAMTDKIGYHVAKLDQLESLMDERLLRLEEIRTNIENVINCVQDSLERRTLQLRYIDGYKWEEVCLKLNYSWRQTHRLHSNALNNLKIEWHIMAHNGTL